MISVLSPGIRTPIRWSRERRGAYIDVWRIARAKFAAICYLLGFMPVKQFASQVKER